MKKRIASLLLALPLCLTLLPTTALAEDEAASDRTVIASAANFMETGIRFPIWIFPKTMERQSIRLSDFSVRFTALKFPV